MDDLDKRKREVSASQRSKKVYSQTAGTSDVAAAPRKGRPSICVFGAESFFMRGFVQNLKSRGDVVHFTDSDKAIDYCMDKEVDFMFLDMDSPTDWKIATDVFCTGKMVKPNLCVFLCSADTGSVPVKTLIAQGGIPLSKPVDFGSLQTAMTDRMP